MSIGREEIKHTAALSRLKIEEKDMEKWSCHMDAIIGFANRLNELCIDDGGEIATGGNGLFNVFRADEAVHSYQREVILANAPEKYDGCYVVPKIVE